MFIKKLSLTDWKSHKGTTFEWGKVNLIRGANNVGKSSVAGALEFLLTGRCSSTGEAGQGGTDLIRVGSKKATLRAEIGGNQGLTIERERNHSGSSVIAALGGRQYAGRQFEEMMEKRGFGRDVVSAALRGGRFITLSPAEQKELLADILKPEAVTVPREIQEAMAQCFDGFIIEQIDLEGTRELEERATKLRAECTAALRELGEPEKVEERPKGAPTSAEVQKKLDSLRAEQNSVNREKQRIEDTWADRSKKRRTLPEEIKLAEVHILAEGDEKRYLEAIEHESETKAALAELQKVNIQIEDFEHQLKGIEKKAGKCPTCGHETDTDELIARIEKSIGAAQSRIPSLQSLLDRFPSAVDARQALRVHREAVTTAERLKKELAELGDAKADIFPNTKGHQEKIDELEGRITKGQTVLAGIAAHEQSRRAFVEALGKRETLASRRDGADRLAKWCGPSGVQAQMAQGKLEPFCGAINAVLGRFGYECTICLDPYSISARQVGSDQALPLDSLSESENWRFSMGFQTALARATGLNLVVLDRADVLVGANRGTMLRTILSCDLEQVFIMASVDSKAKLPDDFTVFDLSLNSAGETVIEKGV